MRLSLLRLGDRRYRFVWSSHPPADRRLVDPGSFRRAGVDLRRPDARPASAVETNPPIPRLHRLARRAGFTRGGGLLGAGVWRASRRPPRWTETVARLERGGGIGSEPAELSVRLSMDATAALESFTRTNRLTLNTVAQGAWALLLARHGGEADVVFGVTFAGRPPSLPGSDAMVGVFVNTLPARVRVGAEEPLALWLRRLQSRQMEVLQFQHNPLVEVQGWSDVPPPPATVREHSGGRELSAPRPAGADGDQRRGVFQSHQLPADGLRVAGRSADSGAELRSRSPPSRHRRPSAESFSATPRDHGVRCLEPPRRGAEHGSRGKASAAGGEERARRRGGRARRRWRGSSSGRSSSGRTPWPCAARTRQEACCSAIASSISMPGAGTGSGGPWGGAGRRRGPGPPAVS